ncbi:MAG: MFS transporter [Actinomycetaceae bacterium]
MHDTREPLRLHGFRSYWFASTAGFLGLAVTTVAVDVLVIEVLSASEAQVGIVRAAQFLPYLLIGVFAGAYVDRHHRRPLLITVSLAQAVALLAIPALQLAGGLTIWSAAAILFVSGCCGVVLAAAEQCYLPDLVPRGSLVLANARLGQSMTVAQTSGPAVGGLIVSALSAPAAFVLGAVSRVAAAVLVARIREPEPAPSREHPRVLRGIADGFAFTYRHRTLGPLAVSTHVWFLGNSIAVTVLGLFVLRGLGLSALAYGLVLAAAGVGGLVGALLATRAASRLGEGNTVIAARALCALTWVGVALTPDGGWLPVAYLCAVQLVYGFSMGVEDPSEMGYRQHVVPRELLGRVSATMRSANRSTAVVGALAGGLLAGAIGYGPTFVVVAAIFALAWLVAVLSPFRGVRVG